MVSAIVRFEIGIRLSLTLNVLSVALSRLTPMAEIFACASEFVFCFPRRFRGVMTTTTASSIPSAWAMRSGIQNVRVLPAPVAAHATTSFPSHIATAAFTCHQHGRFPNLHCTVSRISFMDHFRRLDVAETIRDGHSTRYRGVGLN